MIKRTLAVSGLVALTLALTPSVAHADDVTGCQSMVVNGDFEYPDITGQDWTGIPDGTEGLGWHTEDSTDLVELWNGLAQAWVGREPGDQISEVQYSDVTYVWQDIATTPGTTLDISMEHRGRDGQDHLLLNAGPVDGPMALVVDADDPNDGWYTHSGTYVVPAGQTTTRIQLDPVTYGATGSLVDNIVVTSQGCVSEADGSGLVNLSEGAPEELADTPGTPNATNLLASGAFMLLASGVAILRARRIRLRSSGR